MSAEERYTAGTKRILDLALREALSFGHNHIGPEHLLLALTRATPDENLAARVLANLDVDPNTLRNTVIKAVQASKTATVEKRLKALETALLNYKPNPPPPA